MKRGLVKKTERSLLSFLLLKKLEIKSLIKALFSNVVAFLEGEEPNCHFYYVEIAYYF